MKTNPVKRVVAFVNNQIGIIVLIFGLILILISICGYLWEWEWTGLSGSKNSGPKTLWDWFDLLIIPAVLAAGATNLVIDISGLPINAAIMTSFEPDAIFYPHKFRATIAYINQSLSIFSLLSLVYATCQICVKQVNIIGTKLLLC